jgi:hypothetical protein
MQEVFIGFGAFAVVFVLVIVLGIQMQIRHLAAKMDRLLAKLDQE